MRMKKERSTTQSEHEECDKNEAHKAFVQAAALGTAQQARLSKI